MPKTSTLFGPEMVSSTAVIGLRSLVLKVKYTTILPQVCATFLPPFQGLFLISPLPRACALGCILAPLCG